MIYNVFGYAVHSKLRSSVKEEAKPNMFMVAIFYSYLNSNAYIREHEPVREKTRTYKHSVDDDSVKTETATSPSSSSSSMMMSMQTNGFLTFVPLLRICHK